MGEVDSSHVLKTPDLRLVRPKVCLMNFDDVPIGTPFKTGVTSLGSCGSTELVQEPATIYSTGEM